MKASITHVSIPQPCHEGWNNMHDTMGGRFCKSCQKTVTDFSKLSNSEIIEVLASSDKVCGRFNDGQLVSLNQHLQQQQPELVSQSTLLKIAAAVIAAFSFTTVKAQTKSKTASRQHKTVQNTRPDFEPLVNSQLTSRKFTGKVVDIDGKPLPGVSVKFLDKESGVLTDKEGNFSIESSLFSAANTILVSADGFITQNVLTNSDKASYRFVLAEECQSLTGTVGGLIIRRSFVARIWWAIKSPFRAIF